MRGGPRALGLRANRRWIPSPAGVTIMTLADILTPERMRLQIDETNLTEVLRSLLDVMPAEVAGPEELREKRARDLAFGSLGEVVRLTSDVVAVLFPVEEPVGTVAALGVGRGAFTVTGEGRDDAGSARAVLLIATSRRLAGLKGQSLPTLRRFLKDEGRGAKVVRAATPNEVIGVPGLMELTLDDRLRVEAALTPVSYRVYPDTPLEEVLDLMVRRELHAVPVVGEAYEVMGIVTAGDVLRDLVPRRRSSEGGDEGAEAKGLVARDAMTRTVMCVSEDQPLVDAASLMVNRDVEQLPVVREGELVGFLTREAVLRVLFGR